MKRRDFLTLLPVAAASIPAIAKNMGANPRILADGMRWGTIKCPPLSSEDKSIMKAAWDSMYLGAEGCDYIDPQDYPAICAQLKNFMEMADVTEISYDPWDLTALAGYLSGNGIKMREARRVARVREELNKFMAGYRDGELPLLERITPLEPKLILKLIDGQWMILRIRSART